MSKFYVRIQWFIVFVFSFILASCNGAENNTAAIDSSATSIDTASTSDAEDNTYPTIMKAQSQDISRHLAQCSKKDKGKMCIVICHRPPGNPSNSKTMVLPLEATLAHLRHGHSDHPDTVGSCEDDDNDHGGGGSCDDDEDDGEDSGGGDSTSGGSTSGGETTGGSTSGGETSGGESTGGTTGGDGSGDDGEITIPEWCLVKYEFDKNCDGFDDATGESLY